MSQATVSSSESSRAADAPAPRITVIVPVRNDPDRLRDCLASLKAAMDGAMEVLVLDDASTDRTPQVAREMGFRVVTMPARGGPGNARNHGAQLARGQYLLFIDADVCVHPETVRRVMAHFDAEPDLDALFGSYDTAPRDPHFVSQYKNLFHHYVHQHAGESACTFWAGCGAIKRDLFLRFGGFDTAYGRPSIEDIELGVRLYEAGQRIAVKKDVQATHLKRWTLWGLIKTDLFDRGIPWTRLILEHKDLPNDLNLRFSQRIAAGCAALLVVALGTALAGAAGWLPAAAGWSALGGMVLLLAILVGINRDFYAFFIRARGWGFALGVLPLHVLYYLYSGAALAAGILLHLLDRRGKAARPAPHPDMPVKQSADTP